MNKIEDNVNQDLRILVPASIINEITCFAIYDNHPRDDFILDIIVCTKNCELSEYHNRKIILSTRVELSSKPRDIQILRDSNCKPFYLVASHSEVIILSRRQSLQIHKVINNVERYEMVDSMCNGQTYLRVFSAGDAVPLVFNENFELIDNSIAPDSPKSESLPIIIDLQRKLIEAQYTVQCNENTIEDLVKLRQIATAAVAQNQISGGVVTQKPWIAMCNKKIIIVSEIKNNNNFSIENVHILLDTPSPNLTYTTKLFEKVHKAPYWKEEQNNCIQSHSSVYLLLVIHIEELSDIVKSIIIFEGVITYESYVLPFETVEITASEIIGSKLDVLTDLDGQDRDKLILALLATSEKTQLCLRHIQNNDEQISNVTSVLKEYLQMEVLKDMKDVIIHKKISHDILYGVVLVIENGMKNYIHNVTMYSRSQEQVLALIRYIHDAVPFRIIATTPQYELVSKIPELEHYNEDTNLTEQKSNFLNYCQSAVNQSTKILEYFDECMIKMNESKNANIKSKVGKEINLCVSGKEVFNEFREKIKEEMDKSVEEFICKSKFVFEDDMIIDD